MGCGWRTWPFALPPGLGEPRLAPPHLCPRPCLASLPWPVAPASLWKGALGAWLPSEGPWRPGDHTNFSPSGLGTLGLRRLSTQDTSIVE